jgi:hypothetical protein
MEYSQSRTRAVRSRPWIRLISRLPSQGGSRVLIEVKLPTFAILRRQLLAGGKVQPPFWLEGLADPDGSAVKERVSDAFKRPYRLTIDAV